MSKSNGRYTIPKVALRLDQLSRLMEYGLKLQGTENPNKELDAAALFNIEFPKRTEIKQEPEYALNGKPGIARVYPRGEGYVREFRWRPAVNGVPGRMTGFFLREAHFRKQVDKKKKKKQDPDEMDLSDAMLVDLLEES